MIRVENAQPSSPMGKVETCSTHEESFMRNQCIAVFTTLAIATALPAAAHAGDLISEENHFELSVGFMGGARSYGEGSFQMNRGDSDIAGARDPFDSGLYRNVPVVGPRWESRMVVSHTRLTLGYQIPFAVYEPQDEHVLIDTPTGQKDVAPESLFAHEIRFGLGAEVPAEHVAPFVDLVGDLHLVNTTLAVDGEPTRFRSTSFSMAARAGARIQIEEHIFVEVSGEVGIVGPTQYGGQVMVGTALF